VRGWTWGNSTTASPNTYERRFDLDGRIVSYPLGHPSNNGTVRTLSFDAAGRITASKHTGGPSAALLDQRYDYDELDRLTAFDGAYTSQRFQYDASGNRTQATFGASTYRNTISTTGNRLNSTTGPAPAKQNSFDAAGNLTKDGTIQYNYGSDGRLSSVLRGGVTTGYRYNGLGQRVTKTGAAAVTVHYVYDETGRVIGEYDGMGTAMQETVYLDDLPVAVLKPGTNGSRSQPGTLGVNYVYADHLSTPRVLTRASDNKMVWRSDSADPFGLDQPDQNPSKLGELTYNPRFPGQVFDKETNNHYNYFRDYDPQTGRYVQSDPIGLEGGINTYAYVAGNPLTGFDPLGLDNWGGVGRPALVYTLMNEGYTIMYDPETREILSKISTSNSVDRKSAPGAALPYSGMITSECPTGKLGTAYGTAKVLTGDPRARWIHGGGSSLPDPYAPQQGWRPTMGCTRGQNGDVESLCGAISEYMELHPGRKILYRRD
jgi:RHS repeat-associated protein